MTDRYIRMPAERAHELVRRWKAAGRILMVGRADSEYEADYRTHADGGAIRSRHNGKRAPVATVLVPIGGAIFCVAGIPPRPYAPGELEAILSFQLGREVTAADLAKRPIIVSTARAGERDHWSDFREWFNAPASSIASSNAARY